MLDDRERKLLFEIEHRLLIEEPELAGAFGATPHRPPAHRHRPGAVAGRVAGLTLRAVLWIGPHPLSDAEVTTRTTAGPARVRPTAPPAPGDAPRGRRPVPARAMVVTPRVR